MISRRTLVAGSVLLLPKRARAVVMMPSTFNLAFPGGRAPGFDQNHVALSGGGICRFSSVNLGGTVHTNLLNGRKPDSTSGTLAQSYAYAMPSALNTAATAETFTSGVNFVNDTAFITAMIVYRTTAALHFAGGFGSPATNGVTFEFAAAGAVVFVIGATTTNTALTTTINIPYFVILGRTGTGTNQAFALLTRLDTGQTTTQVLSVTTAAVLPTQVTIGRTTSGLVGGCAAFAYIGGGNPSLAVARAWALDPWSFWYPNRLLDLTQ